MDKPIIELLRATKPVPWAKAILYSLLLYSVFRSSIRHLVDAWGSEDFNYCYLIPLVVLYLIWEKKDRLISYPPRPPRILGGVSYLFA